jgi:hypothetical protein
MGDKTTIAIISVFCHKNKKLKLKYTVPRAFYALNAAILWYEYSSD